MRVRLAVLTLAVFLPCASAPAQDVEAEIRAKTKRFTTAIVSKDLAILDEMFEKSPANVYYDINEGPLSGFDRLKRVWTAAVTNFSITKFDFLDDMRIVQFGDNALQTGRWVQTQVNKAGDSRDITGRASILWRKNDGQWRVWHYHASITPPRR